MLNHIISRPFAISIFLIDLILHVMFMISFRLLAFQHGVMKQIPQAEHQFPFIEQNERVLISITIYFLFRKIIGYCANLKHIIDVFLSSFFTMRNFIQLSSLFLTLSSLFCVSNHKYGDGEQSIVSFR